MTARGIYHLRHPVTGHRHELRYRSKREHAAAVARVAELRNALRLGTLTEDQVSHELRRLGPAGRLTFGQALDAYAAQGRLADKTRERVRGELKSMLLLAPLPLTSLTRAPITRWIDRRMGEGVSVATVRKQWDTLCSVARYAIDRGWLDSRPWGDWRPRWPAYSPRLREACRTLTELVELLAAARALDEALHPSRSEARLEVLIAFAALLGLRQGELAGLRWQDCDESSGTVLVMRQWNGSALPKGRKAAVMRAPAALFEILGRYRARTVATPRPGAPLFPGHDGKHFAPGSQCLSIVALRRAVIRAGLPNPAAWTAHSMRDTFVTLELVARRGDLAAVMARSRHASIKSALLYVHRAGRGAEPAFELPSSDACSPHKTLVTLTHEGEPSR